MASENSLQRNKISETTTEIGTRKLTDQFCDNLVDHVFPRQRKGAAVQNFVAAVLGIVLHGDDNIVAASDQVHRTAHALDHFA